MKNETINIFIKRAGYYEAYITKKDELYLPDGITVLPYDKKITLILHTAKELLPQGEQFKDATYVGHAGSAKIHDLSKYTDEEWFYVHCLWDYMHKDHTYIYKALHKSFVTNDDEVHEIDLFYGHFVFTKPI